MGRLLRENSLTLALIVLFVLSLIGQSITGAFEYDADQQDHGQPSIGYVEYLTTGHFIEAIFENWESEFLQMGLYVVLTAFLHQKGSAESKALDEAEAVDQDPREARDRKGVPWPVRRGGLVLKLYEHSLSIALFLLFFLSFALHAVGGARAYSHEQLLHGGEAVSTLAYLGTSRFWFESFQNWQSEFLSIAAIVVLSIFLRERGSPESKPVAAPHADTGAS
jgi:hypothetical protein